MGDLQFDPATRDAIITNGDFTFIADPSVQNGAVIRDAHCFSLRFPIFGIGLQRIINSPIDKINFEMNRWVQQVKQDGASKATFTIEAIDINKLVKIHNIVSYD
jgi:hypothetical protein